MANTNLELLDLLLTLKKTTPDAARTILNSQPAIAYALISLMVSMDAINIEVFQKTLAEFGPPNEAPAGFATPAASSSTYPQPVIPATAAPTPVSAIPPHMHLQQAQQYGTVTPPPNVPHHSHTPTPPYGYTNGQNVRQGQGAPPYSHTPTPPNPYGYPYQQQHAPPQPPPATAGSYGAPYPPVPAHNNVGAAQNTHTPTPQSALPDALANIPEDQKAMIIRVLSMTAEQINMLPLAERNMYIQIRATLGVSTG